MDNPWSFSFWELPTCKDTAATKHLPGESLIWGLMRHKKGRKVRDEFDFGASRSGIQGRCLGLRE